MELSRIHHMPRFPAHDVSASPIEEGACIMAIRAAILEPTIPAGLNLVIAAAVAGANLMRLVGIPLLLAAGHAVAAWLVLPAVLIIVLHWALVHEAVHAHLHPWRRLNDRLGQVLAVLFLAPFDGLRFGHLSHHALNARPAERAEIFDRRVRSRARAVIVYYVRPLCGFYLVEVASGPLSLLPRRLLRPMVRQMFYEGEPDALKMAERAERVLLGPTVLRRIRTDAVAILLLLAPALPAPIC
jgi:hypothetical protein